MTRSRPLLLVLAVALLVAIVAGIGAIRGGPDGPLASGTEAVVKPVRDLVGWLGDTHDADRENPGLRRRVAQLRTSVIENETLTRRLPEMQHLDDVLQGADVPASEVVLGSVTGHDPQAWATAIAIDRGTRDRVRSGDAVVGTSPTGAGLVGFVATATSTRSTVTLLPARTAAVSAEVAGRRGIATLRGNGASTDPSLKLEFLQNASLKTGSVVLTAGSRDPRYPSLAPPGIPIGRVTQVLLAGEVDQYARVTPSTDLQTLDVVAVLRGGSDGRP